MTPDEIILIVFKVAFGIAAAIFGVTLVLLGLSFLAI